MTYLQVLLLKGRLSPKFACEINIMLSFNLDLKVAKIHEGEKYAVYICTIISRITSCEYNENAISNCMN